MIVTFPKSSIQPEKILRSGDLTFCVLGVQKQKHQPVFCVTFLTTTLQMAEDQKMYSLR